MLLSSRSSPVEWTNLATRHGGGREDGEDVALETHRNLVRRASRASSAHRPDGVRHGRGRGRRLEARPLDPPHQALLESEAQRTRERRKSGDLGSPGKSGDLSSPGSPAARAVTRRPQTAATNPPLTRTRWTRGGFAAGACVRSVMAVAFRGGDDASLAANRPPPILGPSTLPGGGTIELERPPRTSLPRLRVTPGRVHGGRRPPRTPSSIASSGCAAVLMLWDPRGVRWPRLTPRHLRIIRAWVDANAEKWDTQVQAHALLLTNPIVRGVARLVIRLFAPPQPLASSRARRRRSTSPARAALAPNRGSRRATPTATSGSRSSGARGV